ncbi:MAG TPA: group II truncated hemoglobin, partial [Methylophilaceae bacterium]|nr:group II truncated hemoglobin [Methylophilaceae bacterium]
ISEPESASASLYNLIGGEQGLFRLVNVFNDIIETQPAGKLLHILHLRGHGIAHARIELFNFLSGFLGGPSLYVEKYGHSNIRKLHEHVAVTQQARDDWIACMSLTLDQLDLGPNIKARLLAHFGKVATNLINRGDSNPAS